MSAAIQGIYVALFGRPADPGGLAYWTEVTKNGADLSEMLRVLPSLPEYTSRFDDQTPDQVITTVYQNLFGRDPDVAGLAFFKGQLESGAQTLSTIAVHILNGAQGDDKADVDAKVDVAQLFTASLDTPEEIAGYDGADAAALAKKFLDSVDKDAPATAESVEKAAAAVVAGEDPTGGQAPGGGGGGGGGGGPTEPTTPQTLMLTADAETAIGGAANDIFIASVAKSLNSNDILRGSGGQDVLNIHTSALAKDTTANRNGSTSTETILQSSSIETVNNYDFSTRVDLQKATGLKEVWTDVTTLAAGNSENGRSQYYFGASTDTVFGVRGNKTGEFTLSLRFPELDDSDTIKLALDKNAGYTAVSFGDGTVRVKPTNVEVNISADSTGTLDIRNPVENVKLVGGHGVTYQTGNIKNFDSSALTGETKFHNKVKAEDGAVIKTGAGNDVIKIQALGSMTIDAGAGNDTIIGGSGNDTINGGAGNDIIWGDNPSDTALNPALYGDDTINGGGGTNVIVLGTGTANVKLGGQDTVIHDVADGGTNVIFGFNFGPTVRWDSLTSNATNVAADTAGADKTFDIVKFLNADKSTVKIFVGQDNAAYQGAVTASGGPDSFSGNEFSIAGNNVYTGSTGNLELKVRLGDSEIIFANAISKWELGALLGKNQAEIEAGNLNSFIGDLNDAIGDGASAGTKLEQLEGPLATTLIGFLELQKNFDFVA